jgi:hypothetical protein
MIHENEIMMLILGLGVLIFVLGKRSQLKRFPSSGLLILGFYLLLAGWALTVVEGFFWELFLNFLEHACYTAGAVSVAVWSWRVFGGGKEAR